MAPPALTLPATFRTPQGGADAMDEEGGAEAGPKLPALPADGMDIGVLPRVIKTLVERRAVVKKMLKKEKVRAVVEE
ncbi:unnamed protein product, partial [Hapterophycus canaliculatus]